VVEPRERGRELGRGTCEVQVVGLHDQRQLGQAPAQGAAQRGGIEPRQIRAEELDLA